MKFPAVYSFGNYINEVRFPVWFCSTGMIGDDYDNEIWNIRMAWRVLAENKTCMAAHVFYSLPPYFLGWTICVLTDATAGTHIQPRAHFCKQTHTFFSILHIPPHLTLMEIMLSFQNMLTVLFYYHSLSFTLRKKRWKHFATLVCMSYLQIRTPNTLYILHIVSLQKFYFCFRVKFLLNLIKYYLSMLNDNTISYLRTSCTRILH